MIEVKKADEVKKLPETLYVYEKVRHPPAEATKSFTRLGGFTGTDINAMWRIKALTEIYGPCGIGWYVETTRQWTEQYDANHVRCFVNISLYVRDVKTGEWSKPICGTGGNVYIDKIFKKQRDNTGTPLRNKGTGDYLGAWEVVINDDCYKMAETDAFGAACKKLGVGADIYWDRDKSKYTMDEDDLDVIAEAASRSMRRSPEKAAAVTADVEPAEMRGRILKWAQQDDFKAIFADGVKAYGGRPAEWTDTEVTEIYLRMVKAGRRSA